jgi:hypothetical protein
VQTYYTQSETDSIVENISYNDLKDLPQSNVRISHQLADISSVSTTVLDTNLTFSIDANSVYILE